MSSIYLCIVVFLLCLAVFDLFVGVSNDAVNFLQSAVGARVAKFRTVLIIASFGVLIGAVMSSGMMDVARHGVMNPSFYTFTDVMTIFLAVMVTDVIILDIFNTLGMPTSTTVSMVFELLGGTFILATIKMMGDDSLNYGNLLNADTALTMIIGIFASVGIAFVIGTVVMWLSRIVFTFNYKQHCKWSIAIFGGIAFTALSYFIFLKGIAKSPYISDDIRTYVANNISLLMACTFVASSIIMEVLHLCRINIFKFIVLMGTFALAMAFAGNDLLNFIGVPLAGLDAYNDFVNNAQGVNANNYMMDILMDSAQTPSIYLMVAGIIMIVAMATSKKAQNVIKTTVDLSRQDEGEEMFGSSRAARSIVRGCQNLNSSIISIIPNGLLRSINNRFKRTDEDNEEEKAAFDVVRAAVNLVLASMLITFGTNYKLPLSTTYVTFMVAMGSSLADRAWSRESAVFRVTGVLSVIGGWFITAGVAFATCAVVCLFMFWGGIIVEVLFMVLVVFLLIRSNINYKKKATEETENGLRLMLRTHDADLVWELLQKEVTKTQSLMAKFVLKQYNDILEGFSTENVHQLRRSEKEMINEQASFKKIRRQELIGLKRCPAELAIERNTWFHLGANSNQQFIYTLRRMLEPIQEHVENNFNPLPEEYQSEYADIAKIVNLLMTKGYTMIETGNYSGYKTLLDDADACKNDLSLMRKRHIDRIQKMKDNNLLQIALVYLNVIQETQELLSIMRHQLRAAKNFMEGTSD